MLYSYHHFYECIAAFLVFDIPLERESMDIRHLLQPSTNTLSIVFAIIAGVILLIILGFSYVWDGKGI